MTAVLPTIAIRDAATPLWDALVTGAGPAGGMCALLLARRGWRVLLVEKSEFPREKVCGCCLAAAGAALLRRHGLSAVLSGAMPLREVEIRRGDRALRLGLPGGFSLTRSELDSRIANAAVQAGAEFLPRCNATLAGSSEHSRTIELRSGGNLAVIQARVVLACDGMRGSLLDAEPGCQWIVAKDAWMGAAMTVNAGLIEPGRIVMHAGDGGYLGAVALPDGRSHLAAALDPSAARASGGPRRLMTRILHQCGTQIDAVDTQVTGTGLLTRRRARYGAHRVLAVGDACAYIEPFTGEGMTWALRSADLLARFMPDSLENWPEDMPDRWRSLQRHVLGPEQMLCRALRYVLHRPKLSAAALGFTGALPVIARGILRMMNAATPREVPA